MNRRAVLLGLGAIGTGAVGASVWRLKSNHVLCAGEGSAYAPWKDWQQSSTPVEQMIRAAVLAASPHNTQPWRFHLWPDGIDVYADVSRHVGAIDPLYREMDMGVGCAIENLLLGAEAVGYRWSFDCPKASDDIALRPVLRVLLRKGGSRAVSDLYLAIPERHTNRGRYIVGKEVDVNKIEINAAPENTDAELRIFWFQKKQEKQVFGDLVIRATEAIISDQEQSRSSARWLRTSWRDIQDHRDGLTYDAQGLAFGVRTLGKFLPPFARQQADRFWLDATRSTHVNTASAFGIISVRDAKNLHQRVEAGHLWQRMHLVATVQGIALHPLSQPVERRDREWQLGHYPTYAKALSDLQQDDRWQPVMPFRLGYPVYKALPSPRRAIVSALI